MKEYNTFTGMTTYSRIQVFSNEDDETLLRELRENNEWALQTLYERYWQRLYHFALNILRDTGATEDVLQETFVSLWQNRNSHSIKDLKSYLYTVVKNRSLNTLKKVQFTELHESILKEVSGEPEVLERINEESTKQAILISLDKIPERRRKIFIMSRFEGLSIEQISERLNISPRTVENQISLTLKYLRQSVGELATIAALVSETFRVF